MPLVHRYNKSSTLFRYGETDYHISKECLYRFGITFTLPKDSIFTQKFGEVLIKFLIYCYSAYYVLNINR